jgi:peroxidase
MAKAITTAEIANITYNEFLPHLLGPNAIPAYHGYDPTVNPTITEEFEGAAYRFGHSIVSADIEGTNNLGATTSDQALADVFFEPPLDFVAQGGADGLLRHLAGDTANPLDTGNISGFEFATEVGSAIEREAPSGASFLAIW